MKLFKLPLLMLSTALASGCASAPSETFWTKKNDTVFVHHVAGKVDKVEKLTTKTVPDKEAKSLGFTKSQKAFQVADQTVPAPTPVAKVEPKKDSKAAKGESKDKTELARVTSKLDELKAEVRSLKEQVSSAPTAQQTPAAEPPPSVAQQTADPVRMSQ